jgi:hypothetical protein
MPAGRGRGFGRRRERPLVGQAVLDIGHRRFLCGRGRPGRHRAITRKEPTMDDPQAVAERRDALVNAAANLVLEGAAADVPAMMARVRAEFIDALRRANPAEPEDAVVREADLLMIAVADRCRAAVELAARPAGGSA